MYKEITKALKDESFMLIKERRVKGFVNPEIIRLYSGHGTGIILHPYQSGFIRLYKEIGHLQAGGKSDSKRLTGSIGV